MATDFPELTIRNYNDLCDALVAVKNFIGISNNELERLAGLTVGHVDKLLGPSRRKAIGRYALGCLLRGLGVKLILQIDLAQMQRNEPLFEKRHDEQVRQHCRLSQEIIEKAKPIILRQLTAKATAASAAARRRRAKNGNGANGHARAYAEISTEPDPAK